MSRRQRNVTSANILACDDGPEVVIELGDDGAELVEDPADDDEDEAESLPLAAVAFAKAVRAPCGGRGGRFAVAGLQSARLGLADSIELYPELGLIAVRQGAAVRCYPVSAATDVEIAAHSAGAE